MADVDPNAPRAEPSKPKAPLTDASMRDHAKGLASSLAESFEKLIDLQDGLDRDGTVKYIYNNKRMRGANVWLLICSILVASIGLDVGSPAVIIGAMLISPLMSPILGVGLAVGINDRTGLLIALRHFGIAVVVAFLTSYLYFEFISLGKETEEITSRTVPTLLDVGIAIFGGLAGIISTTRAEKSNAIPGVAIATALMPPLCVVGYGVAQAQFYVALNAFYLFSINSTFIALSTFFIVRYLRFPFKSYVNARERRRTQFYIGLFSLIVILPSGWVFYQKVYLERQKDMQIELFVTERIEIEGYRYCVDWVRNTPDRNATELLNLYVSGEPIPPDTVRLLQREIKQRPMLSGIEAYFIQNSTRTLPEVNQTNVVRTEESMRILEAQREQSRRLDEMKYERDSLASIVYDFTVGDTTALSQLRREVLTFLDAEDVTFGRILLPDNTRVPLVRVDWRPRTNVRSQRTKLTKFIKTSMQWDTVIVVPM